MGRLGGENDLLLGLGFALLVAGLAARSSSLLRLERNPSLAGAGEGGRRPGEGLGEKSILCGDGQDEASSSVSDVRHPTSGGKFLLSTFRFPFFPLYARISAGASEFSYTLYLVHFPLLAFFFFVVFQGRQVAPGFGSAVWFAGILAAILIYAAAIWWCFERNTDRCRKWLEQIGKSKA